MNQTITSKNTSINSTKLPAVYNKIDWSKFSGIKMIDYGCGKFNNAKEFINSIGGRWYGYDPYNRTEAENIACRGEWFNCIVCSNVLNVLSDTKLVYDVLRKIADYIFYTSQKVFITVYEGDKSGVGKMTKDDCYQRNERTAEYISMVQKVLGDNYVIKNNVITNAPSYIK